MKCLLRKGVSLCGSFLICLLTALVVPQPAYGGTRVGLVVGIDEYRSGSRLTQAVADANKVHAALLGADFEVPAVLVNPDKTRLEKALRDFTPRARGADAAFLYFSGHGIQYRSDNWIVPADAKLDLEQDTLSEAIRLQDLLLQMGGAELRIVVLDACRNNPFTVNWGPARNEGDGLAGVQSGSLPMGSVVAFSAEPGQKAADNGMYADALATYISTPGLELRQVLERVRQAIARRGGASLPEYTVRYDGSFSFSSPTVPARPSVSVHAKQHGLVQQVLVRPGVKVRAGQLLALLDSSEAQQSVQRSRVAVDLLDARLSILRSQALTESSLDGTQLRLQIEKLSAERELALIKLREDMIKLSSTAVVSPVSGTVDEVSVGQGDRVTGGREGDSTRMFLIRRD